MTFPTKYKLKIHDQLQIEDGLSFFLVSRRKTGTWILEENWIIHTEVNIYSNHIISS